MHYKGRKNIPKLSSYPSWSTEEKRNASCSTYLSSPSGRWKTATLCTFHLIKSLNLCTFLPPSTALLSIDCADGHLLVENNWFFFVSKAILIALLRAVMFQGPRSKMHLLLELRDQWLNPQKMCLCAALKGLCSNYSEGDFNLFW